MHVTFFLLYCAYLLYFIIIPFMHRLYSYSLTHSTPYVTHAIRVNLGLWEA
jgi:hypothetical protein